MSTPQCDVPNAGHTLVHDRDSTLVHEVPRKKRRTGGNHEKVSVPPVLQDVGLADERVLELALLQLDRMHLLLACVSPKMAAANSNGRRGKQQAIVGFNRPSPPKKINK